MDLFALEGRQPSSLCAVCGERLRGKYWEEKGRERHHTGLERQTFLRQDCPPGAPGGRWPSRPPSRFQRAGRLVLLWEAPRPPIASGPGPGLLLKDGVRLHSLSFLYLERFYFFRLFPSVFKEFFQMRDGRLPTSALTAVGVEGQPGAAPAGKFLGKGVAASQDHQQALIHHRWRRDP